MDVFDTDKAYVANMYSRSPIELVYGKGSLVSDANGREYIDLCTGGGVNTFGVADDEWLAAVTDQLQRYQHFSALYYSEPCARLAEQLCIRTNLKKAVFSNSDMEANSCAIRAAKKYAAEQKEGDSHTIVVVGEALYAKTVASFSDTEQGFVCVSVNNPDALRQTVNQTSVAAILFQVVHCEDGVVPLTEAFVQEMSVIAKEKDILLIADETSCGNGRTGALYGYMHYGILPDIVTTANSLSGGLPLSVTLLGEKTQTVFRQQDNLFPNGGNPVACAGALHVLSRLNASLFEQINHRRQVILDMLKDAPGVLSVTGMGLMIGVETRRSPIDVVAACRTHGVLVLRSQKKVCLLPPLNIPELLLVQAVDIFCQACL